MKTTSNKAKLDQILCIKVTDEIKQELDALAESNKQTRSSLIRLILCRTLGKKIPSQVTWARSNWMTDLVISINQP